MVLNFHFSAFFLWLFRFGLKSEMANLFDYNIKRMISFRLFKGTEKTIANLGFGWVLLGSIGRGSGAD